MRLSLPTSGRWGIWTNRARYPMYQNEHPPIKRGDSTPEIVSKGIALLNFLKANATARQGREPKYKKEDKVLWFKDVPMEHGNCRSPFPPGKSDDLDGLWLEVRKTRITPPPPLPQELKDWIHEEDLKNPGSEPELPAEITIIVDGDAECRRLADHPELEDAWLEYLVEKWEPWADEERLRRKVESVYRDLDFMRRRLEEAEERFELVLALGFLQWRDPAGTDVARHVLTAPAELMFDAAKGLFTVAPAASFDRFRIELDMLELQHRPRLNESKLGELLEELYTQAWDTDLVVPVLHEIANSLRHDAQVDESLAPAPRAEQYPRLTFAPALLLRERRPRAYESLINKFLEASHGQEPEGTAPWFRLLREGESANPGADDPCAAAEATAPSAGSTDRLLFPLPTNEEQRNIVHRLESQPCVLVKGPPGTGKSHTIANLICHLLARGDKVLVTAHAPKALTVLCDLLPKDIRDLCVTAVGSSSDEQRLLNESVQGILRRRNEWSGSHSAQQSIEEEERLLHELEGKLARIERDLKSFREAQTHKHELPGGYSGTAAEIARAVSEKQEEFGWFPELPSNAEFPLDPGEDEFLVEAYVRFTPEVRAELQRTVGDGELPDPEEFAVLIKRLEEAERSAQRVSVGVDEEKLTVLERLEPQELEALSRAVTELTSLALRAQRVLGELSDTILQDLLACAGAQWARHTEKSEALLKDLMRLTQTIGSSTVRISDDITDESALKKDVERRLAHFEGGGRKGFYVFAPSVVRETN